MTDFVSSYGRHTTGNVCNRSLIFPFSSPWIIGKDFSKHEIAAAGIGNSHIYYTRGREKVGTIFCASAKEEEDLACFERNHQTFISELKVLVLLSC